MHGQNYSRRNGFTCDSKELSKTSNKAYMALKLLYILNQSYILTRGAMIVPLRSVREKETKRLAPFVLNKLKDGAGATRYFLIEAMFTAQNSPLRHNKLDPDGIFLLTYRLVRFSKVKTLFFA